MLHNNFCGSVTNKQSRSFVCDNITAFTTKGACATRLDGTWNSTKEYYLKEVLREESFLPRSHHFTVLYLDRKPCKSIRIAQKKGAPQLGCGR